MFILVQLLFKFQNWMYVLRSIISIIPFNNEGFLFNCLFVYVLYSDCVQNVDLPDRPTALAQIIHSKQKEIETVGENQRLSDTNNRRDHIRPRYKNTLHLWEFLLQLLNDENAKSIIGWSRKDYGEFKIKDQEEVAKRWGALRNRPGMTYDKLSRAIRSYYSRQIITKVNYKTVQS